MTWASEVFSEHLAQRRDVHHRLRQELLQLRVLVLELLQPLHLGRQQTGTLLLPVEVGGLADPRLPAGLPNRRSIFALLNEPPLETDGSTARRAISPHCWAWFPPSI